MKLIRLKIGTLFRSLPKDFEIVFSESASQVSIAPICLVGANGSGKSNVLEALAEIFSYLNTPHLNFVKHFTNSPEINSFELEYLLPIYYGVGSIWTELASRITGNWIHIKVIKENDLAPSYFIVLDNEVVGLEPRIGLLPQRIIGYSSGQNEILSIPFYKILFKYFHNLSQIQKSSNEDSDSYNDDDDVTTSTSEILFGPVEYGRLQFQTYSDSSLIILANLLGSTTEQNLFAEIGNISLVYFEFKIRKNLEIDDGITINSETSSFLEFLVAKGEVEEGKKLNTVRVLVTDEIREEFKSRFLDASGIYNAFYNLFLLNLNGISRQRMQVLLQAQNYFGFRSSKFEPSKDFFRLSRIEIIKDEVEDPISLKALSDGEHQLLHILCTLNCFKDEVCLFLLDEPETHLNPKWRYEYLSLLTKISDGERSQILMTTHDPVLLSGLKKENVMVFRKPAEDGSRYFLPRRDLFGMGVDAILVSEIFGLDSTLDQNTKEELIELKELYVKREKEDLSTDEKARYTDLYNKLRNIDYAKPQNDPIYRQFLLLLDDLHLYKKSFLTDEEIRVREKNAEEAIKKISDLYSE